MSRANVCCLIPAHNEAGCIAAVVRSARSHLDAVIVVDDGSDDATAGEAKKAGAEVIRHDANLGKGAALRTGFSHMLDRGFEAVLTIDGDGQHDAGMIPTFLEAFESASSDITIGTRLWNREAIPRYRYIPNRIGVSLISRAAGCRIDDTQSGFRLYRREVLEAVRLSTSGFETETEVLIKAARRGFRISGIPVPVIYQSDYRTHFRPVRDFYRISILVLKLSFLERWR